MGDEDLIRKLAGDKSGAFKELVDKYQRLVLATARGFVKNEEDANDLSQEVFIRIYRSLDQFRGESGLSTWIYRITLNQAINYLRDNKKYRESRRLDDPVAGTNGLEGSSSYGRPYQEAPDKELENKDRARFLHEAIDSLPESQKKAFILHKYEDLSYQEIAEILETTIPSVESLLFRARKNMQKKLWDCYKKLC